MIKKIKDRKFWSLYEEEFLEPKTFSNKKTQEDIVREIYEEIKKGTKLIFVFGACGTGKSAIALNLARIFGRTSIVVPIKNLQKQYEEDYTEKKYVLKNNGEKLKIKMITGRENHPSIIKENCTCADPFLPDTIKITEKNRYQLIKFYRENPIIKNKIEPDIKKLKRISIAPSNPYWSPILPAIFNVSLPDAQKKKYLGLNQKEFIFYHRKKGCSYFDQYQAYIDADVIIFNSAKYKIETSIDRKPYTEIDIIDEADEFLDSFSLEEEINLSMLEHALKILRPETEEAKNALETIINLIFYEEKNKKVLGINENKIFKLNETNFEKIIKIILKNPELESEIMLDELNYANKLLEIVHEFKDLLDETYLTFKKKEDEIIVNIISVNLSKRFKEMLNKNKAMVMMSGTIHSEKVLKEIFGIENFKIIEAETFNQGTIDIIRTGKEFNCKYSNFLNKKSARENYLIALSNCIAKSIKPTLVHVTSFEDLPDEKEIKELHITNLISKENLRKMQNEDKNGKMVSLFKEGLNDVLFSTKCIRGIDFPGEICNSVIYTKYPNPNANSIFWRLLKETNPKYYWDFYKDKAQREFLQRLYRALRFKDDHVNVLSPDIRVLSEVRKIQERLAKIK